MQDNDLTYLQILTKGVRSGFWHVSLRLLETCGEVMKRIHKREPMTLELPFILQAHYWKRLRALMA